MIWNSEERQILEALDTVLRDRAIFPVLDLIASRVVQRLQQDPSALLAWDTVPLDAYKSRLPSVIRSSWVFVLRAGATTGAERHPNSHQRVMSWQGNGDLQVWKDDKWLSHFLLSDPDATLERRWASIPPHTWHQAVVSITDWTVVSFHTVPPEELIEERPDPLDSSKTNQRLYVSM